MRYRGSWVVLGKWVGLPRVKGGGGSRLPSNVNGNESERFPTTYRDVHSAVDRFASELFLPHSKGARWTPRTRLHSHAALSVSKSAPTKSMDTHMHEVYRIIYLPRTFWRSRMTRFSMPWSTTAKAHASVR